MVTEIPKKRKKNYLNYLWKDGNQMYGDIFVYFRTA